MPYTRDQYLHEKALELLPELTPEERLTGSGGTLSRVTS
jgi:hypothetical protein